MSIAIFLAGRFSFKYHQNALDGRMPNPGVARRLNAVIVRGGRRVGNKRCVVCVCCVCEGQFVRCVDLQSQCHSARAKGKKSGLERRFSGLSLCAGALRAPRAPVPVLLCLPSRIANRTQTKRIATFWDNLQLAISRSALRIHTLSPPL